MRRYRAIMSARGRQAACVALNVFAWAAVALLLAINGCCSLRSAALVSGDSDDTYFPTSAQTCFKVRGRSYSLSLPSDLKDSLPGWNVQRGENTCVLPVKAVSLAEKALHKAFADAQEWSLDSVELREIPRIDPWTGQLTVTGKWYYEIGFRPPEVAMRTRQLVPREEPDEAI